MSQRVVAFSFLGILLSTAPAAAQRSGGFEVSGAAGYHTYGSATELDASIGYAARLGFWVFGPLSIEGEFNTATPRTSTPLDDKVTVTTFAGWLLGNLPVGSRGSVFLKGGFGTTDYGNCPDVAVPGSGPCGSVGVLQGGAGARVAIVPNLFVRVDGVINTSTSSRKFSNALVQGGLSFMLGGRAQPARQVDGDPDGDGVRTSRDRCPGTPMGSKVDANGCSVVAPAVEPERAPEPAAKPAPVSTPAVTPAAPAVTPAAPKVEPKPVPVTPPPAPVDTVRKDTTAAPKPKASRVIILPGTIWNYRSSSINATGLPGLDSLVALLRGNASLVAEIQGYAQDRLVPSDNTLLSTRRAEAIKSYIVSKGVTPERLSAVGLGSQTLIEADTTDAARITNRRVEVHLRPKP